jgi:hypothetical protein
MDSDIKQIGDWYRENKVVIDAWIKEYNLGSFYELPLKDKKVIYEHITNPDKETEH